MATTSRASDFLVIGGGVIGVAIARRLKVKWPASSVHVIDKEVKIAAHASGRNSGVLHAGFYYSSDSLKARFTRLGNEALTRYCHERQLPIRTCGKLVVAQGEENLPQLDELYRRGIANGAAVSMVTAAEARALEPRVKTFQRALWSPTTSSIDPAMVLRALVDDAEKEGVRFFWGERYIRRKKNQIITSNGSRQSGYVVNAAGLYADQVARDFGFSSDYRILPFKGLYLYSSEPENSLSRHVYPVPDLRNPFLGVHFTITVTGQVKIGPTAIPTFWREQYGGFENFKFSEFVDLSLRQLGLLARANFDFKRLAWDEFRKYARPHLVTLGSRLVDGLKPENYRHWGRPGIRAQLFNIRKRALEMDFVVEGDAKSIHILNAISPALTCSMPFAEMIVDRIEQGSRQNWRNFE